MSLKKEIALRFSYLLEAEGLEKNKLILTTPIGLICGRFPTNEELDDSSNSNSAFVNVCSNVYNEYKSNLSLSENDRLPGDEGYFYLVDVVIKSPNNTFTSPFMVVFYDQIIGVSIGNI